MEAESKKQFPNKSGFMFQLQRYFVTGYLQYYRILYDIIGMAQGKEYYLTATEEGWRLKKAGGTKVVRTFQTRPEAIAWAQLMISRQQATFRLQDKRGVWEVL